MFYWLQSWYDTLFVKLIVLIQMKLLKQRQKKAHIMEIQLNGGTVADKVSWAREHLEKPVSVNSVFAQDEIIDCLGVTNGHGFKVSTKNLRSARVWKSTKKRCRRHCCKAFPKDNPSKPVAVHQHVLLDTNLLYDSCCLCN